MFQKRTPAYIASSVSLLIWFAFPQVLIGKTKVEGEESLRKLVVALNGLAGISMIKQDFPEAVTLYKEALALVKEHSDDFRLDPLLNIHIYYNLAEALPFTENNNISTKESVSEYCEEKENHAIEKEENDNHVIEREEMSRCNPGIQPHISVYIQQLRIACEDLKHKFLSLFSSKLSLAQQEFRKSYEQVCFNLCDFTCCLPFIFASLLTIPICGRSAKLLQKGSISMPLGG